MTFRPIVSRLRQHSRVALLLVFSALILAGCSDYSHELRMYPLASRQMDPQAMQAVFEQRSGIRMTQVKLDPSLSALAALVSNQADLSLVDNSTPFVSGIRTVLPVYRSVLHLLARESLEPVDRQQPFRGLTIHVANQSNAGYVFLNLAARRQGLTADDYKLNTTLVAGEPDLIIYFGPINPYQPSWYQPGYRLVSLDEQFPGQQRFYQEGINFVVPQMDPIVIPALTYLLPGNEGPIQTLSVDTLLVTRKAVSENLIYELTRTLIEQKPRFAAIAPNLFSGINDSFDPLELNFPLHQGTRRYLNRDEPGLLERYAETINMLVYVFFLLLTSLVGFARWRAHRKKDRIDTFYTRVFSIRERAAGEDRRQLLRELDMLEREAFESLIAEKLAADESFRIFTELLSNARATLDSAQPDLTPPSTDATSAKY
jgi:hypothetical protein